MTKPLTASRFLKEGVIMILRNDTQITLQMHDKDAHPPGFLTVCAPLPLL